MQGNVLTSYRRKRLYDLAGRAGEEGNLDTEHLLVHALASTPDGTLEVREDYASAPDHGNDLWTDAERLDAAIDYYAIAERPPEDEDKPRRFEAFVTVRGETTGDAEDVENGLLARLDEFNGGRGGDMVFTPEVVVDRVTLL